MASIDINVPETIYQPSPWQMRYHALEVDEALGAGAAGPGKTTALLWDPWKQIRVEHERCSNPKHPYHIKWGKSSGHALMLRRTTNMLDQLIEKCNQIFPLADPNVKWEASNNWFRFDSGFKYQLGHCKEINNWKLYYSKEYTWLGLDEANQFEEEQYKNLIVRVRSSDPMLGPMACVRCMSNPKHSHEDMKGIAIRDPNWLRRHFVDPWPAGDKILKKKIIMGDGSVEYRTRIYLPAKLKDNPDAEFRRRYEITLRDMPPHIRKALLDGDWYNVPHAYYGQYWDAKRHVVKPFRIPDTWRIYRSMDWGWREPGVIGYFALDGDGHLYLIKEYAFQEKQPEWLVDHIIKPFETKMGLWSADKGRSLLNGPVDPQVWEQRGDNTISKGERFARCGVSWVPANKRWRANDAMLLAKRLIEDIDGLPGFMVFEDCTMTIKTLPAIGTEPDDPETPQDGGDDHWHDMVRYAVAYVARSAKGKAAPKKEHWQDTMERVREKKEPGRGVGRRGYFIEY